jgi:Fe-S-cluster containining protein
MRLCATCAGQGKSCCIDRDILVSDSDLRRIAEHTKTVDFFEMRVPQSAAYLDQEDDPNWNIYTLHPDGTRRVLKHAWPGNCWFLTDIGCLLPEHVRPLVCRLHPVEFTEKKITGFSPECPSEHLPEGESLLANLKMNLDLAETWRQQLYDELRGEMLLRPKAA